jgi:hypothetical protein
MLQAWRGRPQAYVAVADHDFERAFAALGVPVLLITAAGIISRSTFRGVWR